MTYGFWSAPKFKCNSASHIYMANCATSVILVLGVLHVYNVYYTCTYYTSITPVFLHM